MPPPSVHVLCRSTCRFADRCSRLSHEVTVNEVVDLNHVIERLQGEQKQLQEQLRRAQEEGGGVATRVAPLTAEERASLRQAVDQYVFDHITLNGVIIVGEGKRESLPSSISLSSQFHLITDTHISLYDVPVPSFPY